MDGTIHANSGANILRFPTGGRAELVRRRFRAAVQNDNREPLRVDFDAWYHQDAMKDETSKPS